MPTVRGSAHESDFERPSAFVELSTFSKGLRNLYRKGDFDEEGFRSLQNAILNQSTRIDSIQGVSGLYKARWRTKTRGKSGGLRVIYYDCAARGVIYFIVIFPKSSQEDLTLEQRKTVERLVEEQLKPLC